LNVEDLESMERVVVNTRKYTTLNAFLFHQTQE